MREIKLRFHGKDQAAQELEKVYPASKGKNQKRDWRYIETERTNQRIT